MLNLKYDASEHIYETETYSQIQRSDLQLPREKQVRIESKHKLLYIEWINNKDLLFNTVNYIRYPMINHNGKEYEKEYIYVKLNHFATQQKLTQHCKSTICQ